MACYKTGTLLLYLLNLQLPTTIVYWHNATFIQNSRLLETPRVYKETYFNIILAFRIYLAQGILFLVLTKTHFNISIAF